MFNNDDGQISRIKNAYPDIGEKFLINSVFVQELIDALDNNCEVTVESDKITIKQKFTGSNSKGEQTTTLFFEDDLSIMSVMTRTLEPRFDIVVKNFQYDLQGNRLNNYGRQADNGSR